MSIHKEGRSILSILLIVLLLINISLNYFNTPDQFLYLSYLSSTIFFLLVLQFFRSPSIEINVNPKHVLAPADGKVVVIEETEETEYLNEKRIQISIFMSPLNVHINRNPVGGIIKYIKYHSGKYLVAWHPKSSTENERTTIVYELNDGLQILTRQIAGAVARRIKYYIGVNDEVSQGQEFGFIKFGSRLDVFLPLDAKINVKINQKTWAGKTVLAELK
ncbi:MAG: phosphatidylserine decarboxylase family protein [Cyclobacteriaceae bacterium]|nr:phosphatidylserine decarboxylase family protein [Cyclobacteriaceae bacterium]MCK5280260.1 phosphatidylserine decarboxylase family protein [Cyclobacteriaceae bacterium]